MRWGCCTTVENLPALKAAGYDYAELTMVSIARDEAGFRQIQTAVEKSELAVEAFNVLLPANLKVVGPDVVWEAVEDYLGTAFKRAAALGGQVVVFGSGRSRTIPEGFPREKARQQVLDFLKLLADHATRHNLRVGIEPLRSAECNFINYVSEACDLAREVNLQPIGVLADFYHMNEGNEPVENVKQCGDRLLHVHLADTRRMWPGSGSYDYPAFFRVLKEVGYDSRMSLECKFDNFAENIRVSMAFLRETWEKA